MSSASDQRTDTASRRRVGLLGGSFNPAHAGHLYVSEQALALLSLDEVWWLVSPQNPLKAESDMAPLDARMRKAREISGNRPDILVSDIEAKLGTRYTVDTVAALRQLYPKVDFVLLVGADILDELPRWHRWERLFEIVPIAVFARKPYSHGALSGPAARRFAEFRRAEDAAPGLAGSEPPAWVFLHIREHPASATEIRAARGNR